MSMWSIMQPEKPNYAFLSLVEQLNESNIVDRMHRIDKTETVDTIEKLERVEKSEKSERLEHKDGFVFSDHTHYCHLRDGGIHGQWKGGRSLR